jgi:hypothetical protein
MLEKRIVAPEDLLGEGYLFCGSSGVKTGGWVYLDGVFAADGGPSGKAGKPGYAKSGSLQFTACAGQSLATVSGFQVDYSKPMFMMDKIHFQKEDADLTLDTIVSGEGIVCIKKGFVDTDQYATNFFNATVSVGAKLYVDTNGLLTTGLFGSTTLDNSMVKPRAIYWGTKNSTNAATYDSNYQNSGYIYVQILSV